MFFPIPSIIFKRIQDLESRDHGKLTPNEYWGDDLFSQEVTLKDFNDLDELQNTSQQVTPEPTENEPEEETSEVSLDEIKEDETQASEQEDTEATNS